MYINESAALEEAYDYLISNVSLGNICAFLKACWLIEEDQALIDSTLERLVYIEGDQQEVYTRMERRIISDVSSSAYYSIFQLLSGVNRTIDCRLFVIELSSGNSAIYNSIATMKILNKAFDGLNLFMFITPADLHFGCSILSSQHTRKDCMLSYAINSNTDWELLADIFLYRNNSKRIYEFYSSIISAFDGIKYCHKEGYKDDLAYRLINFENDYDIDALEEDPSLYIEAFASDYSIAESEETVAFEQEIVRFERDVESCIDELDIIKKSHVNPLEMLYEAEKALFAADQTEVPDEKTSFFPDTNDNSSDIELLNDPIALMKKLKKDRGL